MRKAYILLVLIISMVFLVSCGQTEAPTTTPLPVIPEPTPEPIIEEVAEVEEAEEIEEIIEEEVIEEEEVILDNPYTLGELLAVWHELYTVPSYEKYDFLVDSLGEPQVVRVEGISALPVPASIWGNQVDFTITHVVTSGNVSIVEFKDKYGFANLGMIPELYDPADVPSELSDKHPLAETLQPITIEESDMTAKARTLAKDPDNEQLQNELSELLVGTAPNGTILKPSDFDYGFTTFENYIHKGNALKDDLSFWILDTGELLKIQTNYRTIINELTGNTTYVDNWLMWIYSPDQLTAMRAEVDVES